MAKVTAATILRGPGDLILNPSTGVLDPDAYPYGGTVLGNTRNIYLTPFNEGFTEWAEEYGAPGDQLEPHWDWGMGCFLRGWDDDVVQACFPNTSQGSVSQHRTLHLHGAVEPGRSRYDILKAVLLFSPDNPRDVPAFLGYAAVPLVEATSQLALQWGTDLGIPVMWRLFRDDSQNVGDMGRIHDLSAP